MPNQCTCAVCGAPFATIPSRLKVGKGLYCSDPCRFAGRRSRRQQRACNQCGAAIDRPPTATAGPRSFCSRTCYTASKKARALAMLKEPLATRLPNGCLIYNGHKIGRGYGQVMIDGLQRQAHVVAWEVANDQPFPAGKYGCHTCDTPACIEPTHVWPGTPKDNTVDMVEKDRGARGERQGGAKLTDDAVREIRRRRSEGATYDALAAAFGVGKSTIARVVSGTHWRHVTP